MKGGIVVNVDFHNHNKYEDAELKIIGYQLPLSKKDGEIDNNTFKAEYVSNFLSENILGASVIDTINENGERQKEYFYYYRDETFSDRLKRFFIQFGKPDEYKVTLLFGDHFYFRC